MPLLAMQLESQISAVCVRVYVCEREGVYVCMCLCLCVCVREWVCTYVCVCAYGCELVFVFELVGVSAYESGMGLKAV